MSSATTDVPVTLKRLERKTVEVRIEGVSPLIPHKWSEKAKRMMLDKQQGRAVEKKAPKDPSKEAADATYWLPDGTPGMPATAFKAATADAARYFDGVAIVQVKQALFVVGEGPDQLVPITGDIQMREDTPRNASGVADLRYRNQIWPWSATLTVEYVASAFTTDAVITLIDAGGNGGVGDWRPSAPKSKTGTYGRYRVVEG